MPKGVSLLTTAMAIAQVGHLNNDIPARNWPEEKSLAAIYKEIDQLEKTKFNVTQFSLAEEEFEPFGIAALILLLIGFLLSNTLFKGIQNE